MGFYVNRRQLSQNLGTHLVVLLFAFLYRLRTVPSLAKLTSHPRKNSPRQSAAAPTCARLRPQRAELDESAMRALFTESSVRGDLNQLASQWNKRKGATLNNCSGAQVPHNRSGQALKMMVKDSSRFSFHCRTPNDLSLLSPGRSHSSSLSEGVSEKRPSAGGWLDEA